jgi:hypothetical protein
MLDIWVVMQSFADVYQTPSARLHSLPKVRQDCRPWEPDCFWAHWEHRKFFKYTRKASVKQWDEE